MTTASDRIRILCSILHSAGIRQVDLHAFRRIIRKGLDTDYCDALVAMIVAAEECELVWPHGCVIIAPGEDSDFITAWQVDRTCEHCCEMDKALRAFSGLAKGGA